MQVLLILLRKKINSNFVINKGWVELPPLSSKKKKEKKNPIVAMQQKDKDKTDFFVSHEHSESMTYLF